MITKIFGETDKFAIEIDTNVLYYNFSVYGKCIIHLNGQIIGDINEDSFIDQKINCLLSPPVVDDIFEGKGVNINNVSSLNQFFFENDSLEIFPFIRGLGEGFDDILLAYFIFKEHLYFLWKTHDSRTDPFFVKINKDYCFKVIQQLKDYLV